jgi:hypothetical protein
MLQYWNVQDSISQRLGARGVFGIVVFFWRHTRIRLNITVLEGVLGGSGLDPLNITLGTRCRCVVNCTL